MAKHTPPTGSNVHYLKPQAAKPRREARLYAGVILLAALVFCTVLFWPAQWLSRSGDPAQSALLQPQGFTCSVSTIIDGDTLRCADGTKVRLHAVAARESDESCSPGHPCADASGAAATAKLTELAGGRTLQCEQTGTSYDRATAICRNHAGVEINCAMVISGMAAVWPKFNAERRICQ